MYFFFGERFIIRFYIFKLNLTFVITLKGSLLCIFLWIFFCVYKKSKQKCTFLIFFSLMKLKQTFEWEKNLILLFLYTRGKRQIITCLRKSKIWSHSGMLCNKLCLLMFCANWCVIFIYFLPCLNLVMNIIILFICGQKWYL